MSARRLALRVAARAEQEIRAYPRLYSAFYAALTRNRRVRELVGRTKDGVRGGGAQLSRPTVQEPAALRALREDAVARRLGLRP